MAARAVPARQSAPFPTAKPAWSYAATALQTKPDDLEYPPTPVSQRLLQPAQKNARSSVHPLIALPYNHGVPDLILGSGECSQI